MLKRNAHGANVRTCIAKRQRSHTASESLDAKGSQQGL